MPFVRRLSGAAALTLAVCFATSVAQAADAAAGEERYVVLGCYTCHGFEGQGGNTGPRIAPPLPLETFATFIRQTSGDMPPFTPETTSDEDLANIHAYLAQRAAPVDPASDPLLRQLQ